MQLQCRWFFCCFFFFFLSFPFVSFLLFIWLGLLCATVSKLGQTQCKSANEHSRHSTKQNLFICSFNLMCTIFACKRVKPLNLPPFESFQMKRNSNVYSFQWNFGKFGLFLFRYSFVFSVSVSVLH